MIAVAAKYFTLTEAAVLLHLNPETIRRHCRSGDWPYHRPGKKYIFSAEHLAVITTRNATEQERRKTLHQATQATVKLKNSPEE